jgi:hypothetical protein
MPIVFSDAGLSATRASTVRAISRQWPVRGKLIQARLLMKNIVRVRWRGK